MAQCWVLHGILTKAAAVGCDEADVFQLCDGIEDSSGWEEEDRDIMLHACFT